jgi:type II secretory pathway pseudopilin PulG
VTVTSSQPSSDAKSRPRWRRLAAFTLLETTVATALCAVAISAFYLSTNHAVRLARAGRETALASEVLEQRLSSVRRLPLWTSVTSTTGISQVLSSASPAAATFPPVAETITVAPYPPGASSFTVKRSKSGAVSIAGASLPATAQCVQVTVQIDWTGPNKLMATRQLSTILTKGGL